MAQHSKNGLALAQHLAAHPKIAWVRYPGLPGDDQYELAQKYLPNGASGVVSFGVAGGRAAAETFMANLKLAQIATHVADARTCVLHPANATHRQMNDAELAAAGITPDLIRLSCGIEATEDLDADVDQALAAWGLWYDRVLARVRRPVRDSITEVPYGTQEAVRSHRHWRGGGAVAQAVFAGVSMVGSGTTCATAWKRASSCEDVPASSGASITFQVFDAERSWEAQNGDAVVKGTIKETVDPNIYLLEDERGEEVGWVHLAYANNEGEGVLYVRYGSDDLVEIDKVDRVPIYQVYD
ncbi:MAG: PLP-dependent transferase [Eggerthella lenta]